MSEKVLDELDKPEIRIELDKDIREISRLSGISYNDTSLLICDLVIKYDKNWRDAVDLLKRLSGDFSMSRIYGPYK